VMAGQRRHSGTPSAAASSAHEAASAASMPAMFAVALLKGHRAEKLPHATGVWPPARAERGAAAAAGHARGQSHRRPRRLRTQTRVLRMC
jgi:hypothetical protein